MSCETRKSVRSAVLAEAESWIGTPYRHQGAAKGIGCDCLGLIRGVWRAFYDADAEEPGAYAPDWAEAGGADRMLDAARRLFDEVPVAAAAPGDLLLFRWRPSMNCKHAGILTGENRFIHAYQGHAVLASPLVSQWRRRIAGAFAFPEIPRKAAR